MCPLNGTTRGPQYVLSKPVGQVCRRLLLKSFFFCGLKRGGARRTTRLPSSVGGKSTLKDNKSVASEECIQQFWIVVQCSKMCCSNFRVKQKYGTAADAAPEARLGNVLFRVSGSKWQFASRAALITRLLHHSGRYSFSYEKCSEPVAILSAQHSTYAGPA